MKATAVVIGLALLLGACTTGDAPKRPPVHAEALDNGFVSSIRSWRDYADVVLTATVTGERRGDPDRGEAGEVSTPRLVDLRVDETLWARHDLPLHQLTLANHGWVDTEGEGERVLVIGETPRLVRGTAYVLALGRNLEGDWISLAGDAVVALEGDVVARAGEGATPIAQELSGRTARDLAERLAALEPDPAVERYAAYSPHIRYELVENGADEDLFPSTTVPR